LTDADKVVIVLFR